MILRCHKCRYVWNYTGNAIYATCPRCFRKVNVEKYKIVVKTKPEVSPSTMDKKDSGRHCYRDIAGGNMRQWKKSKIYEILCDLCYIKGDVVTKEELLKECRLEGLDISEEELHDFLEELKDEGRISEPQFGYYGPVS